MKLTLTLILLLALPACAPSRPNAISFVTGNLSGHLEAAQADLKNAGPHADAVGVALIHSAATDIGVAQQQTPIIEKQAQTLEARATKAESDLRLEKNHWTGWKLRQLGWWTLTICIIVGVVGLALVGFLNGATGGTAAIAEMGIAKKLLRWGGSLLTLLFHDIGLALGHAFRVGREVIKAEKSGVTIDPVVGTQAAPIMK